MSYLFCKKTQIQLFVFLENLQCVNLLTVSSDLYYGIDKSTGKETGKTHLCAVVRVVNYLFLVNSQPMFLIQFFEAEFGLANFESKREKYLLNMLTIFSNYYKCITNKHKTVCK